jgi:hypothetical protein
MKHVVPVLPGGYSAVPSGHIAAVVTFLEMRKRPEPRPAQPFPPGLQLQPLSHPSVERYRSLFQTVGQDWLWYSRLIMPDDELRTILDDPRVSIYAIRRGEHDVGILELDFREPGACELAFFGLTAENFGKGISRTL